MYSNLIYNMMNYMNLNCRIQMIKLSIPTPPMPPPATTNPHTTPVRQLIDGCRSGVGVTQAPLVIFSVREIFCLIKISITFNESHSCLTNVAAAKLQCHWSNMNVKYHVVMIMKNRENNGTAEIGFVSPFQITGDVCYMYVRLTTIIVT